MEVIADLEVHSKYARAVSSSMTVPTIAEWAAKKGIGLMGTGDFTHPMWIRELEANLEEAGEGSGVYRLRNSKFQIPNSKIETLFLLTSEVSCIYKDKGKGRRVHLMIFLPSLSDVRKFNSELTRMGANLFSDGRPIIGLSLYQVASIAFKINPKALVVPAHVWTPWFGFYGSESGYESLEEAFKDLTKYIPAVETGLSSDPAMNWKINELKNRTIVSFGDAHSPQKLGREATVFQYQKSNLKNQNEISKLKITYEDIYNAIWRNEISDWKIGYTIEFYPEEGKYHYSGHRKCRVVLSPNEVRKQGLTCAVCGRKLTLGVASRIEALAKEDVQTKSKMSKSGVRFIYDSEEERIPYVMMVPLLEIIAEVYKVGATTKGVFETYEKMIDYFGNEFEILLNADMEDLEATFGKNISDSIAKVRMGDIFIRPGYDGIFGTVKIWRREEEVPFESVSGQKTLF